MSLSAMILSMLLIIWSSQAQSVCIPTDPAQLWERSDVVFAANLKFSHTEFVQPGSSAGGYLLRYYYNYESIVAWKGDPGRKGIAYSGGSDTITVYPRPVLHSGHQYSIDMLLSEPARTLLMYGNEAEDGLVYGGCIEVPDYNYAFTQRLKLGEPVKLYNDNLYENVTVDELFAFVDKIMLGVDEANAYHDYMHLSNALDALQMLNQHDAMFEFLHAERFMHCQQGSSSLNVMSGLLSRLPDHAPQLLDRFRFMFTCPQVAVRMTIFIGFMDVVASDVLLQLIEQFMHDSSVRMKRAAARAVSRLDNDDKQTMLDRVENMLASNDPDERIFAAVMLGGIEDIDLALVAKVCDAEPASWQYYDDPIFTETIKTECIDLIRTHQYALRQAGLLSDNRFR